MLINSLLFILFILFFIVFPADFILRSFKTTVHDDWLVKIGLVMITGIVLVTMFTLITGLLNIPIWSVWIFPLFTFVMFISQITKKNHKILAKKNIRTGKEIYILLIILAGVICQCVSLFRGGWQTESGFVYPSIHDNMWNIAIINELLKHIPPANPAISGEVLKNHHYFYLLFLAVINYITKIDISDLYFRFGPVTVSFVYGTGLYAVTKIFSKKYLTQLLAVLFGYFSGNFAYLGVIFVSKGFDWKGNTFMIDQPFDQIFNPYSVLGFALMLFAVYCINNFLIQKVQNTGLLAVTSLIIGSSYGFKSFGGIILIFSVFISFIISVFLKLNIKFFYPLLLSAFIFMMVFFLITDLKSAGMHFYPGWILTDMMTGKDKLNLPYFAGVENYYFQIGNEPGFMKIKIIELMIYIIGNLGTRILGLFYLIYLLIKSFFSKDRKYFAVLFLVFTCCITSLGIPLLFNLGGNAHNIVQFSPYSLVFLGLFLGLATGDLYYKIRGSKHITLAFLFVFISIMLSVPVNVKNILGKITPEGDTVTVNEMNAIKYLRSSDKSGLILLNYKQFQYDPVYIAALSGKSIYLGSPGYARQTGVNPDEKIGKADNIYYKTTDLNFLNNAKISYIYLRKEKYYKITFSNLMGASNSRLLQKVFENDEIVIFSVNNNIKNNSI